MTSKIIKIIAFIILLVLLFYVAMGLIFKKEAVAPTNQNLNQQNQTNSFRGPTGSPFIIGPTSPPPKY